MVNRYIDPNARKTPCSIALPNEIWGKIDEYILKKHGGRLGRSAFFEDYVRQVLEDGSDLLEGNDGIPTSVNTIRAYAHRIKDFIATNAKEKKIGNLEAVRLDIVESASFIDQEINRSRTPTKSDKKQAALKQAIAAHDARTANNSVPPPPPPPPAEATHTQEPEPAPEQDPVDLQYEQVLKEAFTGYKEEPLPKPDFEIIDEGKTQRNPYDNSGSEEVFT